MKVLCIKQIYPEDDCGAGPNEFWFVLTENHAYYAGVTNWWESGTSVDSNDYEVNDDTYHFCFDEAIKFISDEKTRRDYDEFDDYTFQAGLCDISEEEFCKLKLVKESDIKEFVENKVTGCFNVSDNVKLRSCFTYLVYDFDTSAMFGDYVDIFEDEDVECEPYVTEDKFLRKSIQRFYPNKPNP